MDVAMPRSCWRRVAGGMAALAAREAVLASPALGDAGSRRRSSRSRRAGREGYAPTEAERRRLAALGAASPARRDRLLVAGPGPAPVGAVAGPGAAAWAVARRRARYRRAVERGLPEVATAVADALAGGRSVARGARLPQQARWRARRRSSWRACAPTSSSERPRPRRSTALEAPPALGAGRLVRRGARSRSSSAAATSPGCCADSPPRRRSATGSPPTPVRRPRRPGSPACSSSRCRPGRRCSPS